ncbi:MAG: CDC48 family AAA ATPase [Nanoarchaeota archaeon]
MVDKNKKQVQLKVAEASQEDVYKGIVRLDASVMRELEVDRGDAVLIKGTRETVAIADRAYPADVGQGIIRVDGILRKNARTGIGDVVVISRAIVEDAKKIIIAPAQKGIMVQGEPEHLRRGLLGRTVIKGDLVVLGGVQRRKDLLSDDFGDLNDMLGNMFGNMGIGNLGGGISQIRFIVVNATPSQVVRITENTEVVLNPKAVDVIEDSVSEINYEDIGGLDEEIKKIREMVEIPLKHPEIFDRLGVEPPKGVLLHGPPGTGKTLLAKAVANESDSNFILLNGPEIMSKFYGESEKKIRDIFANAEKNAPSIVFIDEIDAIAPKREDVHGEVERRVVSQILTMMDGLQSRGKVVVIGATNRVNAIDPALRRPGRFDREIEVGVPNKKGRLTILKIHTRGMPLESFPDKKYLENEISELKLNNDLMKNEIKINKLDIEIKSRQNKIKENDKMIKFIKENIGKFSEDIKKNKKVLSTFSFNEKNNLKDIFMKQMMKKLSSLTHGFVGADLESLGKEAAINVLRKILPQIKLDAEEEIAPEILEKLIVKQDDFMESLKVVRPSAMREVLIETPNISWKDIGGIESVKQELKEAVEWPMKFPESFIRLGIRPSKGVLLYGPPGTGKTLLAKAVAKESEANFIQIKGPSLLSKWVNDSHKGMQKVFERARQVAPCIVFFDEIESLASKRSVGDNASSQEATKVLNQMLAEMDGLEDLNDVLVIAATNRPDMLDTALLRPGRFDRVLLVNAPTEEGRKIILDIHTKKMPIQNKEKLVKELAKKTEGYTGADLESVAREAGMLALRESIDAKEVLEKHFKEALTKIKPSVTKAAISVYQKIEDNFLQSAKAAVPSAGYFG